MFNKHPKGLIAASFANLGERFGFYTMMAILVLFLQAKFGLDGKEAGLIYSTFYFSIYILALIGGIIADRTRNYKGTIFAGIVLMAVGYLMLAIPSPTPVANKTLFLVITCAALFVIAFGNGLFKGNLQALVGQMYDNPQYSSMRDSGFSLFYMFINVGAIFAPFAAVGVRNWWLSTFGYNYDADLPALCHGHLAGTLTPEAVDTYSALAAKATISGTPVTDMTVFANEYLNVSQQEGCCKSGRCHCSGDECTRGKTAHVCIVCRIRCGNFLLVLVPSEWIDTDLFCQGIYRFEFVRHGYFS